jgi:hypothetical protein
MASSKPTVPPAVLAIPLTRKPRRGCGPASGTLSRLMREVRRYDRLTAMLAEIAQEQRWARE